MRLQELRRRQAVQESWAVWNHRQVLHVSCHMSGEQQPRRVPSRAGVRVIV